MMHDLPNDDPRAYIIQATQSFVSMHQPWLFSERVYGMVLLWRHRTTWNAAYFECQTNHEGTWGMKRHCEQGKSEFCENWLIYIKHFSKFFEKEWETQAANKVIMAAVLHACKCTPTHTFLGVSQFIKKRGYFWIGFLRIVPRSSFPNPERERFLT